MVVKKTGLFLAQRASLDVEVRPVWAVSRYVVSQLFRDLAATHRHGQRRRALFSTQRFLRQKPARKQTQRHMMMPAVPRLNFVIRQTTFALGTTKAIPRAMRTQNHTRELVAGRAALRVAQVIIMFHTLARRTFSRISLRGNNPPNDRINISNRWFAPTRRPFLNLRILFNFTLSRRKSRVHDNPLSPNASVYNKMGKIGNNNFHGLC
jgi:hypothetical protein